MENIFNTLPLLPSPQGRGQIFNFDALRSLPQGSSRNFVFGRMSNLKILENTFTIPKSFNIQEHLQSAFGIYKGIPTKEVCLRFSPEKARWIIRMLIEDV